MVLETGTVYEALQSGTSLGLFTVSAALRNKSTIAANRWLGQGTWLPAGSELAKKTVKAENVPVGLESNDGPPRLSRAGGNDSKPTLRGAPPPADAPSTPPAGSPGTDGSKNAPPVAAPADSTTKTPSTNPPQTAPAPVPPPASAPSTGAPASSPPGASQPAPAASGAPKPTNSAGDSSSNQSSDTTYQPTLRRGKPTEPLPGDPTTPLASAAKAATNGKVGDPEKAVDAASLPMAPVQVVPAISDAGGPDPQSYKFVWKKDEEDDRRKQMFAMATDAVRAYLAAQARGQISAKPATVGHAPVAAHKPVAKPLQLGFEHITLQAFDLWNTNEPVMVLSAEASAPPPAAKLGEPTAPSDSALRYSVTLVAKTDIYGNLRKLYSGVTDKYHLDVTPRLELIDAVDADGDSRGELLFRETSDAGTGYVIYRATAGSLWKMFDTLNPEQ